MPADSPKFLTDDKVTPLLVHWLERGMQLNTAAMKAGIRTKELEAWLEKGRAGKEPFTEFAGEIDAALARYEAFLSGILQESIEREKPDLSTARWLLERRFPKRWRAKDPGEEVIPVKSDGKAYTADELRTAADIQEAAAARQRARLEAERKNAS